MSPVLHQMSLAELDANPWVSCGPAAVAGLLRRPLAELRHAFPNQQEGRTWTNLRDMRAALFALQCGFRCTEIRTPIPPCPWPTRGLVLVQFNGSWDAMPIHHPAQLSRTHWIAVEQHPEHGTFVFDVNAVDEGMVSCMGPGWHPRAVWEFLTVRELAASLSRKATGAWWIRAVLDLSAHAETVSP